MAIENCPVCDGRQNHHLVSLDGLPVFCNVQYRSREEALAQPRGRIDLQHCAGCGHFFNAAFDARLLGYGQSYENSLHFSETFSAFARELAAQLVDRLDLRGARVVDIGCGKGDFLKLLCALGGNEGYGFDPSYDPARETEPPPEGIHFRAEAFSAEHGDLDPRLVSCRQVLEHMERPVQFLGEIVEALAAARDPVFYLEVPNALYTIRDLGIWDLIYEHCQYFSAQSFELLARRAGLEPRRLEESFGGQYLALEAVRDSAAAAPRAVPTTVDSDGAAATFPRRFDELLERWRSQLDDLSADRPAVVWGAGSKGVTFVNLLDAGERIAALVDINPHKQGQHIAGSGHRIIAPAELAALEPAAVLIMNPLYAGEIREQLRQLGSDAEVHTVR